MFNTLERDATLVERVTEEIKTSIVTGQLRPGDRFPPERELARQFGVSRTVVREAVRALATRGLLEVHAGSGSIVRRPTPESVAESLAMLLHVGQPEFDYPKVLEVRRLLEVEIAGLAAARRTEHDLDVLKAILAETATVGDNGDVWLRNDIAFHNTLAQVTKNEIFPLLLDSIVDIMVAVRRMGFQVPDAVARTLKYHGMILRAVENGDVDQARQAMRDHLIEAEDTMRKALALQADRNSSGPPVS